MIILDEKKKIDIENSFGVIANIIPTD